MPPERYLELMRHDKKVLSGKLRFVLLERLGEAMVSEVADEALVLAAIGRETG
jgi:3-dehydroquinate synthase